MKNLDKYEAVIGLEIHAQLHTQSKLFCGDSSAFGAAPNTHISPITLAHPGTLPKMNQLVIEHAIKLGLALDCHIEQYNYFARKNYFYPDLPKGYQVSQHTTPICKGGNLPIRINEKERHIRLNRIHMEEDAGKSLHDIDENYTCIDLNRAGVPLLEIVTEPDLHSAEEAYQFLTQMRRLVKWLEICDGNMEEGSMRCDANISIRPKGEKKLGTRVEVKNLNSIRNLKRAIEYEITRLTALAEAGEKIIQETRSFDADSGTTFSLRNKEEADDYRYFPEPDLCPFHITSQQLNAIKSGLPELPQQLEKKYIRQHQLSLYDASLLCDSKEQAEFFEKIIQHTNNYKAAANWVNGPIKNHLNEAQISIDQLKLQPRHIADIIQLIEEGKINFNTAASKIFNILLADGSKNPMQIATELNLIQENNTSNIASWVDEVIAKMPDKVKEYQSGKKGLLGLFAGEVKKISKGKADMQLVNQLLTEKLKK